MSFTVNENREQPYSDYDRFAWFYNRYWGPDFCRTVFEVYESILFPELPSGARILDLCCGTGQIAARLQGMGYDVTGLDGSAEMLEYARVNSGWSEFVHADARSFDPAGVTGGPAGFDAVLSPFDSLNHIMSVEELREVFLRVRAVLRPGGLFLFDLNIEDEEELRGSSFDIVGVDHACIIRSSYDQLKRLKRYDLTTFRLEDGHYQRTDLALYQRYHTTETVLGVLGETGFDRIRIFDARADFGVARRDCRIYYLAG